MPLPESPVPSLAGIPDYGFVTGRQIAEAAHTAVVPAADLHDAVDYILDDCFFAVGQGVGDAKGIDHSALVWWRDRYRAKFLHRMTMFGTDWLTDRPRVTRVCRRLGELAAMHAGDKPSIDVESAVGASKDIERFCASHALRRSRRLGAPGEPLRPEWLAGYWCVP